MRPDVPVRRADCEVSNRAACGFSMPGQPRRQTDAWHPSTRGIRRKRHRVASGGRNSGQAHRARPSAEAAQTRVRERRVLCPSPSCQSGRSIANEGAAAGSPANWSPPAFRSARSPVFRPPQARERPARYPTRIDESGGSRLVQRGNRATVVRCQELGEEVFGQHGPVVAAQVLGKSHEVGLAVVRDDFEDLQHPLGLVFGNSVQQLRRIVESEQAALDTELPPGEREKPSQRQPKNGVARVLKPRPEVPKGRIDGLFRIDVRSDAIVVVLVADDPRPVRR